MVFFLEKKFFESSTPIQNLKEIRTLPTFCER